MRLRPGEQVVAADGAGAWRICEVRSDFSRSGRRAADRMMLSPAGPVVTDERPSPEITVAFALPKGDRPESIVRGLVETGVDRIVPLISDRSVVRPDQAAARERTERFRRVAREAAMQSRRAYLPDLAELTPLADFLADASHPPVALCVPGGPPPTLACPVVVVGPEGGFSESEHSLGLPEFGLGTGILRTETAAVAAGVLMVALRSALVVPATTNPPLAPGFGSRE